MRESFDCITQDIWGDITHPWPNLMGPIDEPLLKLRYEWVFTSKWKTMGCNYVSMPPVQLNHILKTRSQKSCSTWHQSGVTFPKYQDIFNKNQSASINHRTGCRCQVGHVGKDMYLGKSNAWVECDSFFFFFNFHFPCTCIFVIFFSFTLPPSSWYTMYTQVEG